MKTKTTVVVSGAFDVLHPGHLNFFKQAKALGDRLVVIIGRDDTVKKIKGQFPLHSQDERLQMVSAVPEVDEVFIGSPGPAYVILQDLHPDIIALGYDQMPEKELQAQLDEMGLKAKIVRLKPFHPEKYKSSLVGDGAHKG